MRRLVFPVIAALGLVMAGPSSAFADDPAPTVSVKATAGKKLCKVTDTKLDELSGMVATKTGYVVINDSTDVASHKRVFFLDTKCKIVNDQVYSGKGPKDTEDMILSPDGRTLWIADIGDNNYNKEDSRRPTIGLWKMPADGSKKPTLYRLTYPNGDYHDAEALLLTGNGIPLIITKEIDTAASIYQPAGPLVANTEEGVPLKKVGTLPVSATETPGNPLARIGNKTIVGGAIAPGGAKVALRTYTDALEWDVTGNDVLAALKGKPRTTGLPNETQGESITYTPDGKYFDTVSDMSGDHDTANYILQYTPATEIAAVKKGSSTATGGKKWYADLTINQITYSVGAVGLIGLLLVGAGVLGIVRHRRRLADLPPSVDLDDPVDPETELIGVGGAPQPAGVYGARSGPAAGGGGGVYGGAPRGGPVYGGGGPQYGRPQQGQPRGPQPGQRPQPPGRNGVYGAPGGGQYGQPPRGPQPGQGQGQRPQRPAGPPPGGGGQQPPRPPQGGGRPQGPRSQGVYGQPGGRQDGGGRPAQRGGDGYSDRNGRPEGRFDNPGYRR
ncbi:hypothetical protein [Paractinoplanes globisporus]|uniref:Uncharacterized protein n=1 Tax=Paractinoplanes globisporus TaxID=113565 RepID=A0ABW6WM21_9ACTN|nr:hypothetical protein [Actinoplanes globisporus]